ncbi:MAG: hypothetical protein IPM58_15765 [Nitrospira sp.]|nr:hypothetical protein [Nitrospira sp.]
MKRLLLSAISSAGNRYELPARDAMSFDDEGTGQDRASQADGNVPRWLVTHGNCPTQLVVCPMKGAVEAVGHGLALGGDHIARHPISVDHDLLGFLWCDGYANRSCDLSATLINRFE